MLATTPVFGLTEPTDLGRGVLVHTRYRATPLGQEVSNAVNTLRPTKPGACVLGCPCSAWLPSSACRSAPGQLGRPAPLLCHAGAGEPSSQSLLTQFLSLSFPDLSVDIVDATPAKPEAVGGLP